MASEEIVSAIRQKKVAVLGLGKIGAALVGGLRMAVPRLDIVGTVKHAPTLARGDELEKLKIDVGLDNGRAVLGRDVVIIAVNPKDVAVVLEDVAPHVPKDCLIISVATGVATGVIEECLKKNPVVRAMPNISCAVGVGMTALAEGSTASAKDVALARAIFDAMGRTVVLDEKLMDGATGLSGSGPAYVYVFIESLAEGGVKVGIPRDKSLLMAAQTVLGAAQMVLSTGQHPALLKADVTSPEGCTMDGLVKIEEGKLRPTIVKAVMNSSKKAAGLLREQTPVDK